MKLIRLLRHAPLCVYLGVVSSNVLTGRNLTCGYFADSFFRMGADEPAKWISPRPSDAANVDDRPHNTSRGARPLSRRMASYVPDLMKRATQYESLLRMWNYIARE